MQNRGLYLIRDAVKWAAALAAAYLLANIVLIPYYHYTPGIPMDVNATNEIYYPGSAFFTTQEGYSSGRFDSNGYLNNEVNTGDEGYVLVMGSSHAMGKEVPRGYSFCEILDERYGIPVYNIAMDGHLYTDNIKGFEAALKQFPDSSAIVIETSLTEFDIDDLKKASAEQRIYDEASTGKELVKGAGTAARIKSTLQTWFPYRILLRQKLKALNAETKENNTGSASEYREALGDTMKLMRSLYDKPIIIVFHPYVSVDKTGHASATVDNEETREAFIAECEDNDVIFTDMSDAFVEDYMQNSRLCHGFMNTSVGTGHINRTGHALITERLYEVLAKEGIKSTENR